MDIKTLIRKNLINIPGWRTNRKIVVIESDDWGSIRMPSKNVYQVLLKKGVSVNACEFSRYDNLASTEDLNFLFEVLQSVKDKKGNPAIITANTVVANPDFERIEASDFSRYFYVPFTDTLKNYGPVFQDAFELWKKGMKLKIWHPQFHGREHLNVLRWMKGLQNGDIITRLAFSQRHFGLSPKVSPLVKYRYTDAFGNVGNESLEVEKKIIREGTQLFEKIFGYKSKSFIAPAYTWRPELEPTLKSCGIDYLQGLPLQQIPVNDYPNWKSKSKYHYLGQKNALGQYYLVRNCFFEPYKNDGLDWVNYCLDRIEIAFRWHKPAIISTHRLNFIGNLVKINRGKNLELFRFLLKQIVQKWPDIEFKTSDQLGDLIAKKNFE